MNVSTDHVQTEVANVQIRVDNDGAQLLENRFIEALVKRPAPIALDNNIKRLERTLLNATALLAQQIGQFRHCFGKNRR